MLYKMRKEDGFSKSSFVRFCAARLRVFHKCASCEPVDQAWSFRWALFLAFVLELCLLSKASRESALPFTPNLNDTRVVLLNISYPRYFISWFVDANPMEARSGE